LVAVHRVAEIDRRAPAVAIAERDVEMVGLVLAGVVRVEHEEGAVRRDRGVLFLGRMAQREPLWRLVAAVAPGAAVEMEGVVGFVAALVIQVAVRGHAGRVDLRGVVHRVGQAHRHAPAVAAAIHPPQMAAVQRRAANRGADQLSPTRCASMMKPLAPACWSKYTVAPSGAKVRQSTPTGPEIAPGAKISGCGEVASAARRPTAANAPIKASAPAGKANRRWSMRVPRHDDDDQESAQRHR